VIVDVKQLFVLDEIWEIVGGSSKVVLLVASSPINLAFHIVKLLVCWLAFQGTHQASHSQHVDLAALVLFVNRRHVLVLQQHHRTLNLTIFLCDPR